MEVVWYFFVYSPLITYLWGTACVRLGNRGSIRTLCNGASKSRFRAAPEGRVPYPDRRRGQADRTREFLAAYGPADQPLFVTRGAFTRKPLRETGSRMHASAGFLLETDSHANKVELQGGQAVAAKRESARQGPLDKKN